jgi:hypothetical protein
MASEGERCLQEGSVAMSKRLSKLVFRMKSRHVLGDDLASAHCVQNVHSGINLHNLS